MILVMEVRVSKSEFKARALEYFRRFERTGELLILTDRGQPVLKIVPYFRAGMAAVLTQLLGGDIPEVCGNGHTVRVVLH